jgi:hypothetical protein
MSQQLRPFSSAQNNKEPDLTTPATLRACRDLATVYSDAAELFAERLHRLSEKSAEFRRSEEKKSAQSRGCGHSQPSEHCRDLELISADAAELFAERLHEASCSNASCSDQGYNHVYRNYDTLEQNLLPICGLLGGKDRLCVALPCSLPPCDSVCFALCYS